jgi:hypothetical protein
MFKARFADQYGQIRGYSSIIHNKIQFFVFAAFSELF